MPIIRHSFAGRPPTNQSPTDQSSTAYAGPALGRDDPVWTHYLRESSDRDEDLVDQWNKSMDVLLLFAALFSAIVTAFLIESYKDLQPDAVLITAMSVSRMVDLVEAINSRDPIPSRVSLPTVENFYPAKSDIVVNTLWFSSLALSMSVTLIAMLVKEWGDVYRRGDRFSPYYVQVRTRQARYDGLKNWGAKQVVRILPIIMHIALGLFLLGLLLFLNNLNLVLMRPVMAVVITTLGLYLITTLVPLFSTFCPYNTPLSSRAVWGFFYAIINITFPSGEKWNTLPCEKEEQVQSTSTALDRLTAQAVVWLVSHSQAGSSKKVAIRAIANTVAGPEFWDHLIKDKLITLMAQHFISFFEGTLDQPGGKHVDEILNSEEIQRQACCSKLYNPRTRSKESGRLMLPEAYFISVQNGLRRLTDSKSLKLAASGYCGASAWYTSTGRTNRKQGSVLIQLIEFFIKNSSKVHERPDGIPDDLLVNLAETLCVETSYMTWELQDRQMNEAIKSVIKICLPEDSGKPILLDGPARGAMSVELAVISALINDYQIVSEVEIDRLSKEGHDKYAIRNQHMKAHEAYKLRHPYPEGSYLTYSRQWRAVWIAEVCAKNPKYRETHSDALLLLGLAGILRSFPMNSNLFSNVVKLFAAQLNKVRKGHSGRMSLPFILVSSCDIQSQVAHDILATFHNRPSTSDNTLDQAKFDLMGCIVEHGQWFEFQPVFLVEISKMLRLSHDKNFRYQCILALDHYWFMNSASGFDVYSLPHWEHFIHYDLIRVLVDIFESISDEPEPRQTKLGRSAVSCFAKLARTIQIQTFSSSTSSAGINIGGQGTRAETSHSDSQGARVGTGSNQEGNISNGRSDINYSDIFHKLLEALKENILGTTRPDPQGAANQSNLHEMANRVQNGHRINTRSNQEENVLNGGSNANHGDPLQKLSEALEKSPRGNKLFKVFSGNTTVPQIHQDDFNFWKEKIQPLSNMPEEPVAIASTNIQPPVPSSSGSQTTATLNEPQAFKGYGTWRYPL